MQVKLGAEFISLVTFLFEEAVSLLNFLPHQAHLPFSKGKYSSFKEAERFIIPGAPAKRQFFSLVEEMVRIVKIPYRPLQSAL